MYFAHIYLNFDFKGMPQFIDNAVVLTSIHVASKDFYKILLPQTISDYVYTTTTNITKFKSTCLHLMLASYFRHSFMKDHVYTLQKLNTIVYLFEKFKNNLLSVK